VLGIPTGVKMHSGVFATSPEAAGDVVASILRDGAPRLRDAEVMDVDEDALRDGRVSARLCAVARVPFDRARVQHPKAASRGSDVELDALCRRVAEETRGLTLFGPGTTTQRILAHLGVEGTLLGVDAVDDRQLVGADLNEAQLLELLGDRPARLVLGVVGGQGYLFGRGNQQLSPAVIRRIGLEHIDVVAGADKLVALDPPTLRVDTGDPDLDRELAGFRRVRVGPNRILVLNVSA
jgi:predicted polyphosphate/ATP-dependent NAD kinase